MRDPFAAIDANFLDSNRLFMSSSDTGEFVERRDVAIACCGLPAEAFNIGFLKPPVEAPAATAAAVRDYFAGRRLPFRLAFRSSTSARLQAELEAAGWRALQAPTPGMTLAIPASIPKPPAELEVAQVRTSEELVAYREAAFRGFGHPVSAAHVFLNERLLAAPGVALFSGLADGAVVATSMLVETAGVAGIYWVATLEERRGRGYGEALTWAAVARGRENGCALASLQASALGRPVYARMGFEHVLDYVFLVSA
jgi:GNAT superfamily N-acetyltransferase